MEFKIDTKPAYTVILPLAPAFDANLSAALAEKCRELAETGSANFLIDLANCTGADVSSPGILLQLHEQCYSRGQSLVLTGLNDNVLRSFRAQGLDEVLHVAPTTAEAVDMISMEILERDILGED